MDTGDSQNDFVAIFIFFYFYITVSSVARMLKWIITFFRLIRHVRCGPKRMRIYANFLIESSINWNGILISFFVVFVNVWLNRNKQSHANFFTHTTHKYYILCCSYFEFDDTIVLHIQMNYLNTPHTIDLMSTGIQNENKTKRIVKTQTEIHSVALRTDDV